VADVQGKGEAKKKEHREVGEGYDAVIIEDNSDDEDEETLQLRFRGGGGMLNILVIIEKPASLEASLPVPPRKPRNVA
jgi:hypothetical protein